MPNKRKLEPKSGSALILTTILLFVILGMVVSLTYVTVMEQKMSGKTKSSVTSFYNAESGIEWILNKIATTPATDISATFGTQWDNANSLVNCPTSFGDNDCKIYLLDQDGNVIDDPTEDISVIKAVRSVGTQGDQTQRAIEAAVAGTTGGCYVSYKTGCSDSPVTSGCCVSGFTNKGSAGDWGLCSAAGDGSGGSQFLLPPGGNCAVSFGAYPTGWFNFTLGEAYVCCQ